jgi:DNA-binding IclR family transcriptional regulator
MLGTVARAGAVLDLFSVAEPEWGATGVARELGIAKSQAHELLQTLAETGLLQRRPATGRYQLGWRVAALHSVLARSSDVKLAAQPAMWELSARHRATVHLAAWDRDRVIYIDKRTNARATPTPASAIGARLPGHGSAVGKQLLAARPDEELTSLVGDGQLRAFTPQTLSNTDALRTELEAVRQDGVAYDRGELVADVRCVAAAIRDLDGEVIAAISISLPAERWSSQTAALASAVTDSAQEVEHVLRERAGESRSRLVPR